MKYKMISEWKQIKSSQGQIVERYTADVENKGRFAEIIKTIDRSDGQVSYYGPRGGRMRAAQVKELEAQRVDALSQERT
jgi:hypothetical protein